MAKLAPRTCLDCHAGKVRPAALGPP
jgi:hypothetical protein